MSVLKYKDPNTGEYKPVIGGGGGGNVSTPDWNQSDETASDYIKNRPFYEGLSVLLPETTLTFTNSQYAGNLGLNFEEGETYTIVWDGIEYECKAFYFDNGTVHGNALGNLAAVGGTNTGEPFFIGTAAGGDGYTMAACLTGATSATLKVLGKTLKKIDKKYLPQINSVVYIPVTDTGSANNPEYSTTVTVGELKRAIDSGKFVIAKVTSTTANPPLISYYPLISHYEAEAPLIVYFGNPNEKIRFYLPDDLEFDTFEELYDAVYKVIKQ